MGVDVVESFLDLSRVSELIVDFLEKILEFPEYQCSYRFVEFFVLHVITHNTESVESI